MIVVFVLHLLLAGLFAALAAWSGEGALRRMGLPTRWVWLAGLAITAVVPFTLASRTVMVSEPFHEAVVAVSPAPDAAVATDAAAAVNEWLPVVPLLSVPRSLESLALPLLALWTAASLVALGRLVAGHAWLRRRRAGWRKARVQDAEVSIAPDMGPAVVGVAPGSIVLPHWALDASPEVQQLMVEHERQHVRSRDPWLQFVADAAVALAPWHPALHWLRRRLRAAVELDCDARVLRVLPNAASRYAELLIAVAGRPQATPLGVTGAMSLASGPSTLERRIAAMTLRSRRNPVAATALAGAGIVLGVAACETPAIIAPAPEDEVPISAIVQDANRLEADTTVLTLTHGEVEARDRAGEFRVVGVLIDSLRAEGRLPSDGPIVALYDVDGVVVRSSSDLTAMGVSHDAIESVEVLKGTAAAGVGAPEGLVYIRLRDSSARPLRVQLSGEPVELELRRAPQALVRGEQPAELELRTPPVVVRRGQPAAVRTEPQGASVRMSADSVSLLIRGDSPASPLYIMDGVVLSDPDAIQKLDPRDILSVDVIKGAAATRVYGTRAANGAIVVKTRQGGGS